MLSTQSSVGWPHSPAVKPWVYFHLWSRDYKVTFDRAAKTDTYPLPEIENVFTSLS